MTKKTKKQKEENETKQEKEQEVDQTAEQVLGEKKVENESKAADESNEEEALTVENMKLALNDMNDKYLRLNAEFQNYRKRVEKEKSDLLKYGTEKLLADMLPIMDTFDRALSSFEGLEADEKVLDGIKLIQKSFSDFFERNGVKEIEAKGESFDPDKHHAVMSEESDDTESDIVIDVFQAGYTLNDKVIRPSMVKVSK